MCDKKLFFPLIYSKKYMWWIFIPCNLIKRVDCNKFRYCRLAPIVVVVTISVQKWQN